MNIVMTRRPVGTVLLQHQKPSSSELMCSSLAYPIAFVGISHQGLTGGSI